MRLGLLAEEVLVSPSHGLEDLEEGMRRTVPAPTDPVLLHRRDPGAPDPALLAPARTVGRGRSRPDSGPRPRRSEMGGDVVSEAGGRRERHGLLRSGRSGRGGEGTVLHGRSEAVRPDDVRRVGVES